MCGVMQFVTLFPSHSCQSLSFHVSPTVFMLVPQLSCLSHSFYLGLTVFKLVPQAIVSKLVPQFSRQSYSFHVNPQVSSQSQSFKLSPNELVPQFQVSLIVSRQLTVSMYPIRVGPNNLSKACIENPVKSTHVGISFGHKIYM